MRKALHIAAALLLTATSAAAAPFLYADAAPANGPQPTKATLTIDGGSPVACTLDAGRPKCDLASIVTPGTRTLVLTWCSEASITNGTNTGTVTAAGCASSAPFAYVLRGGLATPPAAQLVP